MASWLRRSLSSAVTMRGENCPMTSCTVTMVTVSTRLPSVNVEVAIELSTFCTEVGPPVSRRGTSS